MDPITQGALGAAVAQGVLGERRGQTRVWLYGALSGMAADLDVLIRSSADPLLATEYHRHFTHSLAFVPVGGALVALPFLFRRTEGKVGLRPDAKLVLLACWLGYLTHGLLDVFTSYGTMLLWPFTNARYAWDGISIVDPIVTVPLLIGVVLTRRRAHKKFARAALLFMGLYFGLGAFQHHRALSAQAALAAARGHAPERPRCMPGLATLTGWRGIYVHQGVLYADEVHTPWSGAATARPGESAPLATAWPQHPEAFERWRHFADGYIAWHDGPDGRFLGDERYGRRPGALDPMWGLGVDDEGRLVRVNRRPEVFADEADPPPRR